jgi:hypothetical protein
MSVGAGWDEAEVGKEEGELETQDAGDVAVQRILSVLAGPSTGRQLSTNNGAPMYCSCVVGKYL